MFDGAFTDKVAAEMRKEVSASPETDSRDMLEVPREELGVRGLLDQDGATGAESAEAQYASHERGVERMEGRFDDTQTFTRAPLVLSTAPAQNSETGGWEITGAEVRASVAALFAGEVAFNGSWMKAGSGTTANASSAPVSAFLSVPTDDMFGQQWHLQNNTPGLLDLGDLPTIWDEYTGAGVRVAVIDDAVQRTHHQLDDNYSTLADWDFFNGDTDPSGVNGDNHGTAVAGIIGAARDGVGTVGIAYDATLFGFQVGPFINDAFIDTMIAALSTAGGVSTSPGYLSGRQADVANMSLGTMYSGNFFDLALTTGGPDGMDELNDTIDQAAALGRGGLGTIMVKSAGNSRSIDHDSNASSWNANIHTISVAAVDQNGFVSSYSTHGSNLLISGFGTPGQVVTTDRLGTEGYNTSGSPSGDYTSGFNGTSAAAPMVSGVIALMLEANPDLGWRDVQEILANSARHVGTAVGSGIGGSEEYAWQFNNAGHWNGGGMHFSRDYGFGLVDAHAAVRLAESWGSNSATSANDVIATSSINFGAGETLDGTVNGGNTGITSGTETYNMSVNTNVRIEQIEIVINFETTYLDDFEFSLISPDGTTSQVINDIGGGLDWANGSGASWTFVTNAFWGESSLGTWQIQLVDDAGGDDTIIYSVEIRAHGAAISSDDLFIFTNEFSTYAGGAFGHGTAFNGGAGTNTINAAAVTSGSLINLLTNSGIIDGVAITNSNINRVWGGDGNDTIIGDTVSEYINGGRGHDSIIGGTAAESLEGGAGRDTIAGGIGDVNDTLRGYEGQDHLRGQGGDDSLFGGSANDTLLGQSGEDFMSGGDGSDLVTGGTGNDTMFGGLGADTLLGQGDHDSIAGANGDDSIVGGAGNDTLLGQDNNDTLRGQGGNDSLVGGNGVDSLIGGSGFDTLLGQDGNDTLLGQNGHDSLAGGNHNDLLNGGNHNDTLIGGNGNDTLIGGAGRDSMVGGAGTDIFDFDFASHTGVTVATRDVISQFQQGLDIIDLAGIDALLGVGGNQAFTFIGTAAHTGAGATLRYTNGAVNTVISGDINADGIADFSILLEGIYTLNGGDFIL